MTDSHGQPGLLLTLSSVRSRRHSYHSQADSAGSIPVTRSKREKRCNRTILENSGSLRGRVFGSYSGHLGPRISTPRDSAFSFQRTLSLFCCRHIGSSDLARPCLRHDCAPNVDVLDFDAAKNHLWSHARAGASRPEMPVRLTIRLRTRVEAASTWQKHGLRHSVAGSAIGTVEATGR